MATTCERCGKVLNRGLFSDAIECKGKMYCSDCFPQILEELKQEEDIRTQKIQDVILSTTDNINNCCIESYLDIISIFRKVSFNSDKTLFKAKDEIKAMLKEAAFNAGGNAVIGIQFQYFSSNEKEVSIDLPVDMIIVHGTIVRIKEKI